MRIIMVTFHNNNGQKNIIIIIGILSAGELFFFLKFGFGACANHLATTVEISWSGVAVNFFFFSYSI